MNPRVIYQASDLANRRREFIDAAKRGCAQLRDTDGSSLVMIPHRELDTLTGVRTWLVIDFTLEAALEVPHSERRPLALGELAWLSVFDDDDQNEFHRELHEALLLAASSGDLEPVDQCVRSWQTTARALSDDARRRILTGPIERGDFTEVSEPVAYDEDEVEDASV